MEYEDQSIKILLNQEEEELGDAGTEGLPIGDDLGEEVPAVEEEGEAPVEEEEEDF
jgi:hypothetical protein